MKHTNFKFTVLIISTFMFATTGISQEYKLAYNLQKGNSFTSVSLTNIDITMDAMGQSMDMKMLIEITSTMKLTDVVEGNYVFEFANKRMKMDNKNDFMPMSYDTDHPETSGQLAEAAKAMQVMLSIPLTVVMDKYGKVLTVKGWEKVKEAMQKYTDNPTVAQILNQNFAEESFTKNFSQPLNTYPAKAVKIGDSWESQQFISTGGNDKVKAILTLKSVNGDVVTIVSSSKLDGLVSVTNTEQGEVKTTISGTVENESKSSLKTGMVQTQETVSDLSTVIEVFGTTMPQKIKSKTSTKIQ